MGIASGIASQLGFKAESTVGTRVVPDRFIEYVSESLKLDQEFLPSRGLRASRHTPRRRHKGRQSVSGDVVFELAPQSTGLIFKHTLGGVDTTGSGPYTHTFTHGVLDDLAFTVQISKPDEGGTARPFDIVGAQITNLKLDARVGEIVMATMSLYGAHEDRSQSLASASYPASWTPYTYLHGVLTIASSEYAATEVSIDIPTGIRTGRHVIRSTNPERPRKSRSQNTRAIGGTIRSDFFDLTAYERAVNQTAASLSLVFTSGTNVLTISGSVEFDVDSPNVSGEDMLELGLPFHFMHATSDASAFTVTLVNADSTP